MSMNTFFHSRLKKCLILGNLCQNTAAQLSKVMVKFFCLPFLLKKGVCVILLIPYIAWNAFFETHQHPVLIRFFSYWDFLIAFKCLLAFPLFIHSLLIVLLKFLQLYVLRNLSFLKSYSCSNIKGWISHPHNSLSWLHLLLSESLVLLVKLALLMKYMVKWLLKKCSIASNFESLYV